MTKKKTFVLRISPEMLASVEKWAADDFRSINGQLEWIISGALKNASRYKPSTEVEPENNITD